MSEFVAVCRDCGRERPMPNRDTAEHGKRVHENEADHTVVLEV